MSRGLGKVERAVVRVLEREAAEDGSVIMSTYDLYCDIFSDTFWENPRSQYNSLARALRSLAAKRIVVGCRIKGQKVWATAEGAASLIQAPADLSEWGVSRETTPLG